MSTITGKQIVYCARTYIGTPWHHAARTKGVAIDCAGLLVCVSHELGVPVVDQLDYSHLDEYELMTGTIEQHCNKVTDGTLMPGDIIVFRGRRMYNHCAFYTGDGFIIHAYGTPGVERVVLTPFEGSWQSRVDSVYRYKGVTY